MQQPTEQNWNALHQRKVSGEALNPREQAEYEAGCRELDSQEQLDGNLERMRSLRSQIAQAKADQQRMQNQEQALDARIKELESRLDARTRELLGIAG